MPLSADEIAQLASEPQQHSADGETTTSKSADDVIKLDQYAAAKTAVASSGTGWGNRIAKAVPPGGAPH